MPAATITLEEGFYTTASARGHEWHADLNPDQGGGNNAPNPEELLMGALGSCMAQTAKLYAERKGWQIDRIEIKLDFARFNAADYTAYEGDARFIHEVIESISIEGPLDDAQKARILEIMGKCPVRRVLANPVFFVEAVINDEVVIP